MPKFFRKGTLRPGAGENITCLPGFWASRAVRKVIIYRECLQTQVRIPGDPVENAGAARACGQRPGTQAPDKLPTQQQLESGFGSTCPELVKGSGVHVSYRPTTRKDNAKKRPPSEALGPSLIRTHTTESTRKCSYVTQQCDFPFTETRDNRRRRSRLGT